MIILETGRDSDNDKHNKHHKYTLLYKQCQNSEMKVITQIYLIRAQAEVSRSQSVLSLRTNTSTQRKNRLGPTNLTGNLF